MHLNDNSLFCVFTSLDVICSPNSRFIMETMVSSLFRWPYNNLEYPRFISFLYLPCVFLFGTCSYLAGITLIAWSISLTNMWLTSLSYALSPITTDNGKISDVFVISGPKSMLSCLVGARLILILQIICCSTSAANDNLLYFLLLSFALSVYIVISTVKRELLWIQMNIYNSNE